MEKVQDKGILGISHTFFVIKKMKRKKVGVIVIPYINNWSCNHCPKEKNGKG